MKKQEQGRPLCALELLTDGAVVVCLPDLSVARLSLNECLAIQQMLRPYLTKDEITGFKQAQQLTLLDDERQAS